ncbi:fibronectin type III domain-containing protein [Lentilactobacillus kefiri]|uniref:fibronectin type III domain-containing protein n=1 Tax=Lentilactobacillus kefiri TaxID=33962 RepID=UPI00246940D0|nr:fibronectin type III domain-containing protein [Lentilactobacillus kefiri]MDH5108519.1 fibronectin type III domain-containing protein [Lentilactobacillus kefiri]
MAYDLAKVTANGNNLIAQILANKSSLSVDKIEISDTQLPSTTDISTMTSVPKVVQTVSANGFSKNSNTLIISTVVDNSSIRADYKAWVFGIWGSDSQNGQSQLIAVITSTNSPDTIPAFSGRTPVSYTYKFNIGFSNASQIKFNMINDSFATNDTVVHTTGDETVDGKKTFKVDPVDKSGDAYGLAKDIATKVTDNKDGTEQLNGVKVQPFNKLSDTIGGRNLLLGTSNQVVQANNRNMKVADIKYDKSLGGTLCASVMINNADHASELFRGSACVNLETHDKSGKKLATVNGNYISYNASGLSWCSISINDNVANVQAYIWTNNMNVNAYYSCLKIEQGSIATDWTPAPEDKVNVSDMRKPANDVAGIEEVNVKQDKIGYTPADDSKVVHSTDASNWQKHKLTADDGSAKLVIASGEDVNEKLKAIVGTKDTGKLLVDINAKNNPTGHSLIGEYFCDLDGLVTGYGIGPGGAMWNFTYNGTTTLWKLILTAKKPGIPKLAVKYKATSKVFDYTLTAPEKDGLSDITQYNLLWKNHGVDDWTTVIVKPDSLTGQLTGVDIKKTYDFKAAAQNAVGTSGFTDVITLGTATVPGIPKLAVKYNAGKKGFDYTVTAPESDGGSKIAGYNLEYQKQGGRDWTKVALKPDSLTGTVTDGIEAGSDYLFRVNAENSVGASDYFTVSDPLPTVDGNIYGVSWDGSSSGALQRTDASVGLRAGINGAQNDFDTRGPWGLMDKTVTDSYGNAFVRIPKFYIRKTQDKSKPLSTWQVSLVKQGADWYLPNCFYDFDNKKELDYVDVSRYEGSIISGKLQSKTGVTPTNNQSIVQLRSSAVANNTDGKKGYHLWDVHTLDALQVLFTIEFATLDSQSIMKGNTDNTGTSLMNTGATDNVKGSSGFVTSGAAPMTYRGIENLYGNLAMWTDGLNISNLSLYSCDDATKYVSDTFTNPYYKVSYPLTPSADQNITGLGFDKNHPGVTAPTSFNSDSYNTYYHDDGYVNGSGNYVVYTGGSWDWYAGFSGLWFWYGSDSSTDALSNVGSRLLKKAL